RVEILKALMAGAKLLILDEPTSVLAPQEVDTLFVGLDKLRSQGLSVIIITHKLHEARAICDRVTVLRGGRVILSAVDPTPMTDHELVDAMVGRSVPALPAERPATPPDAPAALELTGVSVKGDRGQLALKDVTLSVRKGEILGIAGVSGNGQRELYDVALGLRAPVAGSVRIGTTDVSGGGPTAAIEAGAVGVPEDPVTDAVVPGLSVTEHMALGNLKSFRKGLGIDWKSVRTNLGTLEDKAQLRMQGGERTLADLSGGNIQRVMLTRALATPAPFVAAAYPSRGLDVATTRRTQELLLEQRASGAGVLFISEDLDELMELSDRIAVLHSGSVAGIVDPKETDRYEIGRLMLGGGGEA
ncbi:MAG: ral nucleoside transport system ATP-binding protein, partial [Actinomycetota bacterium]|nr:ral nucleoside transport system ATP-binding protein [Actinomycetota bacterium]